MNKMFPDEIKTDNKTVIVDLPDRNPPADVFITDNSHLRMKTSSFLMIYKKTD